MKTAPQGPPSMQQKRAAPSGVMDQKQVTRTQGRLPASRGGGRVVSDPESQPRTLQVLINWRCQVAQVPQHQEWVQQDRNKTRQRTLEWSI